MQLFGPFIIFVKSAVLDVLNTFWILNTVLNMSLEALTTFSRSFILDIWLCFRYVSDIKYYFRFSKTLNQIIKSHGCWEVLSRKAALEILHFLKYIIEISYRNKDKITAKYWKGVILKMSKLRNDFHESSVKNSCKKWFLTQLNSTAKVSRAAVIQESLALNFKWNALTAWILWQHTHS